MALYHGTNADLISFSEDNIQKYPGFWLSEDPVYAGSHGNRLYEVNADIQNPLVLEDDMDLVYEEFPKYLGEDAFDEDKVYSKEFRDFLIDRGYDAFRFEHHGADTVIILHPEQAKGIDLVYDKNRLLKAMDAAGYTYDDINSGYDLCFNYEGGSMRFENWKEVSDWLNGVVFDDPEISDRVEFILKGKEQDMHEARIYDKDLGLDGEVSELVRQADMYTDSFSDEALEYLSERAKDFGYEEKYVQIPKLLIAERAREARGDGTINYERLKIEEYEYGKASLAMSNYGGEIGRELEIMQEGDQIIISLTGMDDKGSWHAAGTYSVDEFMQGDAGWLEHAIGETFYYTMQYDDPEIENNIEEGTTLESQTESKSEHDEIIDAMNECIEEIEDLFGVEHIYVGPKPPTDWIRDHVDLDAVDMNHALSRRLMSFPITYKDHEFNVNCDSGRLESDLGSGISMGGGDQLYWAINNAAYDVLVETGLDVYIDQVHDAALSGMQEYITPENSDFDPAEMMSEEDKNKLYEHFCEEHGGSEIADRGKRLEAFKESLEAYPHEYAEIVGLNELMESRAAREELEAVENENDMTMNFNTGKEMLDALDKCDLYRPDTGTYAFLYNEAGSICVYDGINSETAKELAEKTKEFSEAGWDAFLGTGGSVYEDPGYEDYDSFYQSNIEWCNENYAGDWINTDDYLDYAAQHVQEQEPVQAAENDKAATITVIIKEHDTPETTTDKIEITTADATINTEMGKLATAAERSADGKEITIPTGTGMFGQSYSVKVNMEAIQGMKDITTDQVLYEDKNISGGQVQDFGQDQDGINR